MTSDDEPVGVGAKLGRIPAGQFGALRETSELNPFAGVTVTIEVPVDPTVAVAPVALSVKEGGGGSVAITVNAIVVLAFSAPLVPVRVSE